jgi:Leucine-rich repeat (LRR) protein
MKKDFIKIVFLFLMISGYESKAQLLDSAALAAEPEYTSLAEALKNPEKVYKLNLRKQKLKEVPKEVFTLTNLQELNLSKNELKEIPKEIVNLKNLEVLNVSLNKIDTIYPEIGQLSNIKKLILNQNFIAHLPSSISQLKKMWFLDLWKNYIKVFPADMAKLDGTLKVVDMRVINMNETQQENIAKMLPNTRFFFSMTCNCN